MPSLAWFIHGCCRALSDSRLSRLRIAAGFLFLLSLRDPSVSAQTPATAPGSNRPDASPAAGAPISVEELAHRLERLEQQNAKLAEQNHSLVKQLEAVTSRYDQLNRRLEQIEPRGELPAPTLPAPVPTAVEGFPDAARQLQTDQAPLQGSGPGSGFASGETREAPDLSQVARRSPSRHAPHSRSSWSAATTTIEACSSWSGPGMSSAFRLSCGSTCSRRCGTPTSGGARTRGSTAPARGSRSAISPPARSCVTSSNSRASESILGFSSRRLSSLRPHSTTRSTWAGSTTGSAMPSTSGSATGPCPARGSGTSHFVSRSARIASWRRRSSVPTSAQASGRKVNRSRMSITSRCWRTR